MKLLLWVLIGQFEIESLKINLHAGSGPPAIPLMHYGLSIPTSFPNLTNIHKWFEFQEGLHCHAKVHSVHSLASGAAKD